MVGWLQWGFYDQPAAADCSEFTGLAAADGQTKAWGRAFQELTRKYAGKYIPPAKPDAWPGLNWDNCITSTGAGKDFTRDFLRGYRERTGL